MDKKGRKDKIAFWMFILWVLFLPALHQSAGQLRADDISDFEIADESGGDFVADDGFEAVDDFGGDFDLADNEPFGADDGFSDFDKDLPPLSIDPNELLASVESMVAAKQYAQLIRELGAHEDAVEESAELLHVYVEALMNADKPDWNKINRYARFLGNKDRNSSLANYAQGSFFANRAKPDLAKAADYLKKAMSAKKPYPGASSAYYTTMAKRFWQIGIILVLVPIVLVVKIIQKKKAAIPVVELDLDSDSANDSAQQADIKAALDEADKELDAALSDGEKQQDKAKDKPKKSKSKKKKSKKPSDKKGDTSDDTSDDDASDDESVAAPAETYTGPATPAQEPAFAPVSEPVPDPAPEIAPVAPVEPLPPTHAPQPPAPVAAPLAPPPEAYSPPPPVQTAQPHYNSISDKFQAEIDQVKTLAQPRRREPVQADPQLDMLWSSLCRKALRDRISPQYRSASEVSATRPGINKGYREDDSAPSFDPSAYADVSIDLSEEALKEDLVGKLKMLAISDNELRDLLAQKNPAHVPYLIEYILTRPEPVRLSFVARELGNYKDTAVIDMLASLLYHDDDRVALAAIQGLEKSKAPGAVMHLCPFLKSETPLLAQAARTALSGFGAAKILQAFKDLPRHPDAKIREAGVFVLSRMKGAKVEELLIALLNDESLDVRTKVILAMSYQKNPVYLEPLREFFRMAAESDKAMARKAIVYLQGFAAKRR